MAVALGQHALQEHVGHHAAARIGVADQEDGGHRSSRADCQKRTPPPRSAREERDRKSTRLNSSHSQISYAVFCFEKKKNNIYSDDSSAGTVTGARTDRLVCSD